MAQIGDTATNKQTGEQVRWDGTQWLSVPRSAIPPMHPQSVPEGSLLNRINTSFVKGITDVAGMPSNLERFGQSISQRYGVREALGLPPRTNPSATIADLPNTAEMQQTAFSMVPREEFKSGPGKVFGAAVETLPGSLLLGGGSPAALTGGMISGASSETAAQAGLPVWAQVLVGIAAPVAAGGIWSGIESKMNAPKVPTADQAYVTAKAAFKDAEAAGLKITGAGSQNFADDVSSAITKDLGYNPMVNKRAAGALEDIQSLAGQDVSLEDLMALRRSIQNQTIKFANPQNEAQDIAIGEKMVKMLDEFVAKPPPGEVLAGDPMLAAEKVASGREWWRRMSNANDIQDSLEVAGLNTAKAGTHRLDLQIRNEFARLIKSRVRSATFTDSELEMMRKIVDGGPITKTFELISRMAPSNSQLATLAHIAIGGASGGSSVPLSMGAEVGKWLSGEMATGRVNDLSNFVLSGGASAMRPPTQVPWAGIGAGTLGAQVPRLGRP